MAVALGLFPPMPEGSAKGLMGDAFKALRAVADAVDAVKVPPPPALCAATVPPLRRLPPSLTSPLARALASQFLVADNLKLLAHYGVTEDTVLVFTGFGDAAVPSARIPLYTAPPGPPGSETGPGPGEGAAAAAAAAAAANADANANANATALTAPALLRAILRASMPQVRLCLPGKAPATDVIQARQPELYILCPGGQFQPQNGRIDQLSSGEEARFVVLSAAGAAQQ